LALTMVNGHMLYQNPSEHLQPVATDTPPECSKEPSSREPSCFEYDEHHLASQIQAAGLRKLKAAILVEKERLDRANELLLFQIEHMTPDFRALKPCDLEFKTAAPFLAKQKLALAVEKTRLDHANELMQFQIECMTKAQNMQVTDHTKSHDNPKQHEDMLSSCSDSTNSGDSSSGQSITSDSSIDASAPDETDCLASIPLESCDSPRVKRWFMRLKARFSKPRESKKTVVATTVGLVR